MKPIARYHQTGEINFQVDDKDAVLRELKDAYGPGLSPLRGEVDELDGVTIDCFKSHSWWANIRKSNTEPLLRLNPRPRTRKPSTASSSALAQARESRVDH